MKRHLTNNRPTMSSTEAAALILSEGKTTDVDEANMMASGSLFDPERLQKAHFRRMLGFDFSILHDEKADKWIVRDDELNLTVRTPYSDDYDTSAARLAKACLKLKQKHDKVANTPEGETDAA